MALRCFAHQSYDRRELIVVDDGAAYPVSESTVTALGGRLIRLRPGTPLGTKLNVGVDAATGPLCMKMDDDDWYGPDYIEMLVSGVLASQQVVCRPTIAFLRGFLFFELPRWEIVQSTGTNVPGATLFFGKKEWAERPFRPVYAGEDVWFIRDQIAAGRVALPVQDHHMYLALRHRGHHGDRGHTWTHQGDGQLMEEYLSERDIHTATPEELLPDWAVAIYRRMYEAMAPQEETA